jgi:hypothetical protein
MKRIITMIVLGIGGLVAAVALTLGALAVASSSLGDVVRPRLDQATHEPTPTPSSDDHGSSTATPSVEDHGGASPSVDGHGGASPSGDDHGGDSGSGGGGDGSGHGSGGGSGSGGSGSGGDD